MLISKHENDFLILNAQFIVENFQVIAKMRFAVAPAQFDFEYLATSCECCQTCHYKIKQLVLSFLRRTSLLYTKLFHCHPRRLVRHCLYPYGSHDGCVLDVRLHLRRGPSSFGYSARCIRQGSCLGKRSEFFREERGKRKFTSSKIFFVAS